MAVAMLWIIGAMYVIGMIYIVREVWHTLDSDEPIELEDDEKH